jgi:hypothetical protein
MAVNDICCGSHQQLIAALERPAPETVTRELDENILEPIRGDQLRPESGLGGRHKTAGRA